MASGELNKVFSKILRYPTEETVVFANNLLPVVLKDKSKKEIKEYLTGETTDQNDLRLKLNNFSFTTRKARDSLDKGLTFGFYNIPWEIEDSKYKQVNQQDMMLLNLLFLQIKKICNKFVYAVLISIELTNQLPFKNKWILREDIIVYH